MIESIKRYRQNRDSINSANFDIKIHQTSEGETIDSIIDEIYPEIILSKQAQILKSSIQIMNKYNRDLDNFNIYDLFSHWIQHGKNENRVYNL